MPGTASKGRCTFCGRSFTKPGMARHLPTCQKRPPTPEHSGRGRQRSSRSFHLVVSTRYTSPYWLQVEASSEATLADLDDLLRATWLECCGHLSAFRLGDRSFSTPSPFGDWSEDESSLVKIGKLLASGQTLGYDYDFGSTTELSIRVAGEHPRRQTEAATIVARNDPPTIVCSSCERPATSICSDCQWEDAGWLCDVCAPKHACGEEMLLPVVNSPRTGVCGYTGPYVP